MKKNAILLLLAILTSFSAFSYVDTIRVHYGGQFYPDTLKIYVGDSVYCYNFGTTIEILEVDEINFNLRNTPSPTLPPPAVQLPGGFSKIGDGFIEQSKLTLGIHYYRLYRNDSTAYQGGIIWVQPAPADSLVISVANNGVPEINVQGGTLQLLAKIYPLTYNQDVTWSIIPVDSNVATLSSTGLVTAQNNGSFYAKAVSNNDAALSNMLKITVANQEDTTVSIKENTLEAQIAIYPNPIVYDKIFIELPILDESLTIKIVDMLGKVILEQRVDRMLVNKKVSLDLHSLVSGNYILQIRSNQIQYNSHIIKN